ncbi:copper amine oxidase N-terminal domain-containing protein [Paenibacillus wulumuqiensis]|uniref:copper amine oxidase N-terminal domain-containing protein n=1 Tax=Paenibacillus wulumuqiensis TaxID=1567107 RepID=UPI000619529D|nr:copper amine oxidase N-terminal domain-containing protein [Paenibacillus wulumuqiensis]
MKSFKLFFVLIISAILLTSPLNVVHASREKPAVYVNNQQLDIFAGMGSKGVTYVPFRPIFEKLNMTVNWDSGTKSVTAKNDKTTITLTNNSYTAYVNGEKVDLLAPPFIDPNNNSFNVNLRFVAESSGAKVTWVKKGNDASIYITNPNLNKN